MRHLIILLAVVASVLLASGVAAAPPLDLPVSDVFDQAGKLTTLRSGATYQASLFPIALRVTPHGSWTGAQWKANNFSPEEIQRRHLSCPSVCKPPYFGWAAIAKGGTSSTHPPEALILVMTGYTATPSVAATITRLRETKGVTYQPPSQVKLAGLAATQFEGETVGATDHFFVPFSPPSHGAAGSGSNDNIEINGPDHPFQFTVLNVRGKTIVVFVGSLVQSASEFQSFLPKADTILQTLSFPR